MRLHAIDLIDGWKGTDMKIKHRNRQYIGPTYMTARRNQSWLLHFYNAPQADTRIGISATESYRAAGYDYSGSSRFGRHVLGRASCELLDWIGNDEYGKWCAGEGRVFLSRCMVQPY